MSQQSQSQEPERKQSKFLSWVDERLVGPLITIPLTSFIAGKIVIQITGVQFNIGLMVLVTLVLFVIMGVSFFLGMGYILLSFGSFFTKQKPPLLYRIVARISFIVLFPLWWKERKNTQPPDESIEQMLARMRRAKQESKDTRNDRFRHYREE